ncbi:MAG: hypothetical protein HY355_02000 [Armatimonadetes bacterium]|nr:hypothetical protein [Armatimonadota bacterium]
MWRGLKRCVLVVIGAVVASSASAVAQVTPSPVTLPNEFTQPVCGFSFRYPEGWTTELIQNYFFVIAPQAQAVGIMVGIRNVAASPLSPQSAAASAAGQFCLDCLRDPPDKLLWVDRFTEGSMTGSRIIFRSTAREFLSFLVGQAFADIPGYGIFHFLFEDGTARNLGPGRWTTGQANFWVREELFQQYEPWMMAIVRSLKFIPPQQDCWG